MTYFKATMQRELDGLNRMMWLGYIAMCGRNFDDLLPTLGAVLGRLGRMEFYTAAYKCILYDTSIK